MLMISARIIDQNADVNERTKRNWYFQLLKGAKKGRALQIPEHGKKVFKNKEIWCSKCMALSNTASLAR